MELVAAADPTLNVSLEDALAKRPEVLVDFTVPTAALANARKATEAGVHVVIGTTGFDLEALRQLDRRERVRRAQLRDRRGPDDASSPPQAAKHMSRAEIIELHHDRKVDAPSGTAARTARLMHEAAPEQARAANPFGPPARPRGAPGGDLRRRRSDADDPPRLGRPRVVHAGGAARDPARLDADRARRSSASSICCRRARHNQPDVSQHRIDPDGDGHPVRRARRGRRGGRRPADAPPDRARLRRSRSCAARPARRRRSTTRSTSVHRAGRRGDRRPRRTVVAGVGSNDTRHAVKLTERATELGADALLSVNPYYNRPSRRGIIRHYEEVSNARPTCRSSSTTSRSAPGPTCPTTCSPSWRSSTTSSASSRPTPDNLAKIDGLEIYAGNDDLLADVLDLGEPGGILVASHIFGEEMHRMVDEPERRREIDAALARRLPRHGDRAGGLQPSRRR